MFKLPLPNQVSDNNQTIENLSRFLRKQQEFPQCNYQVLARIYDLQEESSRIVYNHWERNTKNPDTFIQNWKQLRKAARRQTIILGTEDQNTPLRAIIHI